MRATLLLALCACAPVFGCDSGSARPAADPERLYAQQACINCHGADRRGSALAPPLLGLDAHWSEEQIVEYLADPLGFARRDPRLSVQGRRYPQPMPSYAGLSREQRALLARWLLAP